MAHSPPHQGARIPL